MKLYHGSEIKNLTQLDPLYSNPQNFEGEGCYFTDSFDVAKEYAGDNGFVYEAEIDEPLLDFSNKKNIKIFLSSIFQDLDFDVNDLEHLDAALYHLEHPVGKNGIWSLHLDVIDIFKFEPLLKHREDLKDFSNQVAKKIQDKISGYKFYKIPDPENGSNIYVFKGKCSVKLAGQI